MEHEAVAVGVRERSHVTHARVECLVDELDAAAFELLARLLDVDDPQGDRRAVRRLELALDVLRIDQVQEDVVTELELGEAALAGLRQPERVALPRLGTLQIGHRHGDEVDVLDFH